MSQIIASGPSDSFELSLWLVTGFERASSGRQFDLMPNGRQLLDLNP